MLTIIMEGGLINAVVSNDPQDPLEVMIIDYDTEGSDSTLMIPQGSLEKDVPAHVRIEEVNTPGIPVIAIEEWVRLRDRDDQVGKQPKAKGLEAKKDKVVIKSYLGGLTEDARYELFSNTARTVDQLIPTVDAGMTARRE